MINIHTFLNFWHTFHLKNHTNKLGKAECSRIWEACNFQDKQKQAIKDIKKTNLTAIEYLKLKL